MSARTGILLVGGNGFLGSAMGRALAAAGREVHVLSRSTEPGRRSGIVFHRGSQDDRSAISPALERCGIVVHLASTTTPGTSARIPAMDTEQNVWPGTRLIDRMTESPPERFIFVSSGGSVYGNPSRLPADESLPLHPLSYHAAGKIALEALFFAFANANAVPFAILRPSNLYGPGQPLTGGFGVIRTLLQHAQQNEAVEMWGDGTAVRDYLFIDDAVAACLRLIDEPGAIGPFNAGSSVGTSIRDLIALVKLVTGRDIAVTQRPARATDVRAIALDSTRLRRETGWTAQTGLEEGLRRTWAWLQAGRK